MPVAGHWHMRQRTDRLPRAAIAGDRRHRAGRARARPRTARWRSGSGWSRPRSATSGPRCTSSSAAPHLPRDDGREAGSARRSAGSAPRARSGRRWARRPRTWCRWCWPRSTAWRRRRSRRASASSAPPTWWLLRRLRGLGFQVYWPSWVMSLGAAAGAGPLRADPAAPAALRHPRLRGMGEAAPPTSGRKGLARPRPARRRLAPVQGGHRRRGGGRLDRRDRARGDRAVIWALARALS